MPPTQTEPTFSQLEMGVEGQRGIAQSVTEARHTEGPFEGDYSVLITCPFCGAAAKFKENPPLPGVYSAPRYRLTCSSCAETVVGTP